MILGRPRLGLGISFVLVPPKHVRERNVGNIDFFAPVPEANWWI